MQMPFYAVLVGSAECVHLIQLRHTLDVRALQYNEDMKSITEVMKSAQKPDPDVMPLYKALANNEVNSHGKTILSASQKT